MGSIRSCNSCTYVSFPLRMGVSATELQPKYDKLKDCFSFLISSISFRQRLNNPSFEDEARLSGRIDEDLKSFKKNIHSYYILKVGKIIQFNNIKISIIDTSDL